MTHLPRGCRRSSWRSCPDLPPGETGSTPRFQKKVYRSQSGGAHARLDRRIVRRPREPAPRLDWLMLDLSSYAFSALREGELTLYRGSGDGLDPILLVAPVGEYAPRESLKRLEHEYALRDALDAQWAARPTALAP